MKLLSIRLHPFGGLTDRTITLRDGLNVLEKPNEFGKSTLTNALWHALHTPTNLTPAKLAKAIGRWYPQPGGDHISLTLQFEAEARNWTLDKTWGAGGTSRLQGEGLPAIAEATRVQEKLLELLRLNEATWRNVLFINQAELARTLNSLREASSEIDDIHGLLAGAAAIPGDIPADRLLGGIVDRIDAHFGRWDIQTKGPAKGRGIDDPWRNGTGPIVDAYYAREGGRKLADDVVQYEQKLDTVNERVRSFSAQLAADAEFVQQGRSLRIGLSQRGALEEKITRLAGEERSLMAVVSVWPGAEQIIKAKEEEHIRLGEILGRLDLEIAAARKHASAETLRKGQQRLVEAQTTLEHAKSKLAGARSVDAASLRELREVERGINQGNIEIAAQKLAAKLESTGGPTVVTLHRGSEAPETVALEPGQPWQGAAAGRIVVEAGDVRITVQSGMEDVDALFAKLQTALKRQEELLQSIGCETLVAAEAAAKTHEELAREVKSRESLYSAALQGKSAEEWASAMAELAALPATRDLAVLEPERTGLVDGRSKINAVLDQERQKVAQWSREHANVDNLMSKVIETKAELHRAKQDLSLLPLLPKEFRTVADYFRELDAREQGHDRAKDQLRIAQQEHSLLGGAAPERTAEELRAELELKEREFERQLAVGQSLLRIRSKLEAIIQQRGNADVLQGLREALSRHLKALTVNRYTGVLLEGAVPVEVNGASSLSTGFLSQGTLGSLAMATRLALAELYLRDDNGFFVLDDPFTDMDPARRGAAMRALGAFAERCQVLFFTCHPQHRQELQDLAGAQVVEVG